MLCCVVLCKVSGDGVRLGGEKRIRTKGEIGHGTMIGFESEVLLMRRRRQETLWLLVETLPSV